MPVVDCCTSLVAIVFVLMIRSYNVCSFHWLSRPLPPNARFLGRVKPLGRFYASAIDLGLYSEFDEKYMQMAVECARQGYGHTFPNPAVGCVLVSSVDQSILGRGYHPRAGYPHAEIFALFEAAGHVPCGCTAAAAVIDQYQKCPPFPSKLYQRVLALTEKYQSPNGTQALFGNSLYGKNVTAYVTLEPCCHGGKRTPPCTGAILASHGISRVVVGLRDPNPRVDGGGVTVLKEQAPITVVTPSDTTLCAALVTNFAKRITAPIHDYNATISGRMRRALRTLASQRLAAGALADLAWGRASREPLSEAMREEVARNVELPPPWMEHLDGLLWQHELVLLRLNTVVRKRKAATILGQRIAEPLNAHVAQTKGHTVLLYRPSITPEIDLQALIGGDGELDVDEEEEED